MDGQKGFEGLLPEESVGSAPRSELGAGTACREAKWVRAQPGGWEGDARYEPVSIVDRFAVCSETAFSLIDMGLPPQTLPRGAAP